MNMRIREISVILAIFLVISMSFSITNNIFSDTFENPTHSNNIWTLGSGWSIETIDGLDNSMYSLFNQNSNWGNATVTINTTGYKNIQVGWTQYKYNSGSWGSSSELKVYANNTQLMDETTPYQVIGYRHYTLDNSFDNSVFNLTFSGDTGSSDYIVIDNVYVTGEIISYQPHVYNYGYTDKTSTNSYACIWVKATGQYADNVSYAVAKVTAPNGNTFSVMLTDNGKCNIKQNGLNDGIYAGEFYIGDEDGTYTINKITVYSLTGNYSNKQVNGEVQVYKPSVYYTINYTDNRYNNIYKTYEADTKICSTYSYDKHFDNYYIDTPDFIYVYGYIKDGTYYNATKVLSNDGHTQYVINDLDIPAYGCKDLTLVYAVDPYLMATIDQEFFYYQGLHDKMHDYWSELQNTEYGSIELELLNNVADEIIQMNHTVYKIYDHPSQVRQSDIDSFYQLANRINEQYMDSWSFYNLYIMDDYRSAIISTIDNNIYDMYNYLRYIIYPSLQQINSTVNDINGTVNVINSTTSVSLDKLELIYNNTLKIKNATDNILDDISALNQSEQQRYLAIINNIDIDYNNIMSVLDDIHTSLGYNQTTETLRSDILQLQDNVNDLNLQYNQLYQLTQEINSTTVDTNNIVSHKTDVYYTINLTDDIVQSGSYAGLPEAYLNVCSTYNYEKNISTFFIEMPKNVYAVSVLYNGTDYTYGLNLYNGGTRQVVLYNLTLEPNSCKNFTIVYDVDPTLIIYADSIANYYDTLKNMAYNYWIGYLRAFPENQITWDIYDSMQMKVQMFDNAINDISQHPSHAPNYDINNLYVTGNKIEQQFNTIYGFYQYRKMWEAKNDLNNEFQSYMDSKVAHIDSELQQMNTTINEMNNTVNDINATNNMSVELLKSIVNNTVELKNYTLSIMDNISELNQTANEQYMNLIGKINNDTNDIILRVNNLSESLGYSTSTETLRSDIQVMNADINDIHTLEHELYDLTQQVKMTVNQVNATTNNINSNLISEINMLKQMYNCSYTATNSICYKLDVLRNDILNMNQSNLNSVELVRKDIKNINTTLGCDNGTLNKECIMLQNINRKLPNLKPVNATNITGLPTIGQKLTGSFTKISSIDWSSIYNSIASKLKSIFDIISSYIGKYI